MNRYQLQVQTEGHRVPRACGDEPLGEIIKKIETSCSPRLRG